MIYFQMITRTWTWALLILTLYHVVTGLQDLATLKQKFEYKHSFKGPNLVSNLGEIPFWNYGGSKCFDNSSCSPVYIRTTLW